jgi:hypothetical protein
MTKRDLWAIPLFTLAMNSLFVAGICIGKEVAHGGFNWEVLLICNLVLLGIILLTLIFSDKVSKV